MKAEITKSTHNHRWLLRFDAVYKISDTQTIAFDGLPKLIVRDSLGECRKCLTAIITGRALSGFNQYNYLAGARFKRTKQIIEEGYEMYEWEEAAF